jgi:hypothetical protein
MVGLLAGCIATACDSDAVAPTARAAILRPTDTTRFEAAVTARRCEDGKGLTFEALRGAQGMLVWLRDPGDSFTGSFSMLGMKDTVTRRGAVVSVRFLFQTIPHMFALDSGAVVVDDSAGRRRLTILGSGLDMPGASRATVDAAFHALPSPTDSVSCRHGP